MICDTVTDAKGGVLSEECGSVKDSRGAGSRSCASSRPGRWQRGRRRVQRRKQATAVAEVRTGGFRTTTPPFAHADPSFDVSRWKVENLLLERTAARTLAARRFYQTALRTFLKCVKENVLTLGEDVEIDGALVAYSRNCFLQ